MAKRATVIQQNPMRLIDAMNRQADRIVILSAQVRRLDAKISAKIADVLAAHGPIGVLGTHTDQISTLFSQSSNLADRCDKLRAQSNKQAEHLRSLTEQLTALRQQVENLIK